MRKVRNPMYNKIPAQQVIQGKKAEPNLNEFNEFISDWLNEKESRRKNVTKDNKTRQKKRNNRYAKEERIYGE